MKARLLIVLTALFFVCSAYAQEYGYTTVDVGAGFKAPSHSAIFGLHLAANARIHSGFHALIGYNKIFSNDAGKHEAEEGGGPGISLGYRYYFKVRPYGFFIGAGTDLWHLKINWRQIAITGTTKTWALVPQAEMGYMILINDMFFISPSIGFGTQSNLGTQGEPVGDGFRFIPGISAGFKF
jgi:hypothetical protein